MPGGPNTCTITGIVGNAAVTEINIRSGPNTGYQMVFKAPVGTRGATVLDVQPDDKNTTFKDNNKLYQWFKLRLPDGREGWARDDLLTLDPGDWTIYGYGVLAAPSQAFSLMRMKTQQPGPMPIDPDPLPIDSLERVKRAAFNIAATFEGSGYAAYQNYDTGIVSYGRFQFTLAAGSLFTVLEKYLAVSTTPVAAELRNNYLTRAQARDEGLRKDTRFKELLIQAANEQAMKDAQDAVATTNYWDLVQGLSIKPRNIRTPLGQALIFDMAINHGPRHDMLSLAEQGIGVPAKSPMPDIPTEQRLITKLAEVRRDRLYRIADKNNYPGLKVRGDFWVALVKSGDWNLQGDASGSINIKGRMVQVRNP